MSKKRKWNDEYARYGFTALLNDREGPDRQQCMPCHFIMRNSNLKSARLKEHQAKHPAAEHELTFQALQAKGATYCQGGTLPSTWIQANAKTTIGNNDVGKLCIATCGQFF